MIYLMGGLGNRLFQYYEFIRTGKRSELCSYLTRRNISTSLLGWNIHEETRIDCLFKVKRGNLLMFISHFILNKLSLRRSYFEYFQPVKWDYESIEELKNWILPSIGKSTEVSCVLHYRGTDSDWANEINNYYTQVLCILDDFLVVTDDKERAERCLDRKLPNDTRSLEEDFSIMIAAKVLVVGPSTLSWWAAILSDSIETVYIPRFVFDKLGFPDIRKKLVILD
jgi:hypothetical protein